ncbi:MAG TPA: GNAT family N-acetyltransferase [Anaerolineales bacterium]|nr:GNAT family N-acetyltransferase [Anaerolineales bacterium]
MITIRPIHPDEIPAAKRIIMTVAYNIFGWDGTLEDSIRHFESVGEYDDMDHVQTHYFENRGLFLAALDDDQLIGSGAIRKWDETTAELKRMWLLEAYHGKGIGFQLFSHLSDFARSQDYKRILLQTSPEQTRAIAFYHKLGFHNIPRYNNEQGEISMELKL